MKLAPILNQLGFDERQERVYRVLLSLADAPASKIAQMAEMKRTSVYYILEELAAMGLVSSYQERGVKRYFAEHPSRLKAYFEGRAVLAERLVPVLEAANLLRPGITRMQVLEGAKGIRAISDAVLELKDTTILSMGSSARLIEMAGGTFGYGMRRRKRNIFSRSLRFKEDNVRNDPTKLQDIRLLPDSFSFPGYLIVFGDSVGLIPFEHPPRSILIQSPVYADMMRALFENMWNLAGQRIARPAA